MRLFSKLREFYYETWNMYRQIGLDKTYKKQFIKTITEECADQKSEFIKKRADGTIDDTDYHLASSMLSYIDNECSFIDGFNLVQEAVDPEQYRKVMKKIFEKLEQSQHYRMMTHEKD